MTASCLGAIARKVLAIGLAALMMTGSWAQTVAGTSCSGVVNADVFGFAQSRFPALLAGTPVSGQLAQYDYRYYPSSENYLAIDTSSCMLYLLGRSTNNVPIPVVPVSALAAAVSAWRASTTQTSALQGQYSGTWSGTCLAGYDILPVSGSFAMAIAASASVSGTYSGSSSGRFSGSVDSSGSLSTASGLASGGAFWSGVIVGGGVGSVGTWSDAGCAGNWRM